jgi:hypothetical protein
MIHMFAKGLTPCYCGCGIMAPQHRSPAVRWQVVLRSGEPSRRGSQTSQPGRRRRCDRPAPRIRNSAKPELALVRHVLWKGSVGLLLGADREPGVRGHPEMVAHQINGARLFAGGSGDGVGRLGSGETTAITRCTRFGSSDLAGWRELADRIGCDGAMW